MSEELCRRLMGDHLAAVEQLQAQAATVAAAAAVLVATLRDGGTLLLCGNGGSAADAQHLAAELTGRFECERRPLPALALATDGSALTAIGNDYAFAQVFARQVEALGRRGDCLVAISTSGNSPNVLAAADSARRLGLHCVGLSGRDGGALAPRCTPCVTIPVGSTARIQECHILVGHIWCALIDRALQGDADLGPQVASALGGTRTRRSSQGGSAP